MAKKQFVCLFNLCKKQFAHETALTACKANFRIAQVHIWIAFVKVTGQAEWQDAWLNNWKTQVLCVVLVILKC